MTTCQCQKPLVNAHGCCGYCGKGVACPKCNAPLAGVAMTVQMEGEWVHLDCQAAKLAMVEHINEVMLPPSGAIADGLMEFVEKATDCRCGFLALGRPGETCSRCCKTVPVFNTTTIHVSGEIVDSPKGVEIQRDGGGTVFYNPPNDIDLDICPRCKVGRDSRFMVEGGACCYGCFEAWMFARIADLEAENSRLRIIQADRERKAANPAHIMQYHAQDAARTRTTQLEGLAKQFMRENRWRAGEVEMVEEVKGNCIVWHFRKRESANSAQSVDADRLAHATARWRDCLEVIEQTYKRHPNGVGVPQESIRGNALYVLDWRPDEPKRTDAVKVEHVVKVDGDTVEMICSVTDLETFASLVVGGPFPLEVESDGDE